MKRILWIVGVVMLCTGCTGISSIKNTQIESIDYGAITSQPESKTEVLKPLVSEKADDKHKQDSEDKDYELKFVDVKGNEYTTTILASVKKHKYDFKMLKNNKGIYSYTDPITKRKAKFGIDVSKYQGDIDWNKLKKNGVEFVIIRLGFRGYGKDGTLNLDARFNEYIKGVNKAGIKTGVYFFSQAINDKEAQEEAEYVIKNIKKYKIEAPVVYDTEEMKDVKDARTAGIDKKIFTNCCIAFCDTIKEAGYSPMIYFNMKWQVFTLDVTKLTKYKKWYADYEKIPQSPYEFAMWQYTETGKIDGVTGNIDLNLWFE